VQIRIVPRILPPVRRGDKSQIAIRAAKHNIAGLIPHEQGTHYPGLTVPAIQPDDADRIRQMIHHPDFMLVAYGNGYRFHAHGQGSAQGSALMHRSPMHWCKQTIKVVCIQKNKANNTSDD